MNNFTDYLNIAEVQSIRADDPLHVCECANYDPDLAVEDICIVATERQGLMIAEVLNIKTIPSLAPVRHEIVGKVDTTAYSARIEQRKKLAELKAKMQERAKKLQDIVLYQTLAKDDPEMAQLLSEYMDLGK